ncbi:MAG: J domain-containing protein [Rhodospirillaceae bacterium]|nr:J domain-containing protein [Rhodospirillaceae bacterium]
MMTNKNEITSDQDPSKKVSYTVSCASSFRDAVIDLARQKNCNVADIARSIVLALPEEMVRSFPDPGEPARDDRETVILKSGKSKGKPWRRKPRLQVRLSPGFDGVTIRKALALGLAIHLGRMKLEIQSPGERQNKEMEQEAQNALLRDTHEEIESLKKVVSAITFEPLPGGVTSRENALYVLGFPPGSIPDLNAIRLRFRRLATVYHPDGKLGSHERMSQLNAAMEHLSRGKF